MLARAETSIDSLPFSYLVQQPKSRPKGLLDYGSIRHLAVSEHAFFEGDKESHIYRIEDGLIRLYRLLADGRRQIIAFRSAGHVIGIGSHGEQFCSAEAVAPATLRALPLSVAGRRMHEEPRFQAEFVNILAGELAEARRQLALLNRRSALEKVAAFIVDQFRRAGSSRQVELQVSRNDMADFLGLTIETVSRTLTKLRNQFVIEIPQAHSIRILDIDRLEELADGNFESERTTKRLKTG